MDERYKDKDYKTNIGIRKVRGCGKAKGVVTRTWRIREIFSRQISARNKERKGEMRWCGQNRNGGLKRLRETLRWLKNFMIKIFLKGWFFHAQQAVEKALKALLIPAGLWIISHSCGRILGGYQRKEEMFLLFALALRNLVCIIFLQCI